MLPDNELATKIAGMFKKLEKLDDLHKQWDETEKKYKDKQAQELHEKMTDLFRDKK
jgi:hypothetical protein